MIIKEIKVEELEDFSKSLLYRKSKFLPITIPRIRSQVYNPHAKPEDTALIIAINENNDIVAYIGILPGKIILEKEQIPFFWNTCWWAHPVLGKGVALKLFLSMIKYCDNKLIFFELTPHTEEIVRNTGWFQTKKVEGIKLVFRTYLFEQAFRKGFPFKLIAPFLWILDNISIWIYLLFNRKLRQNSDVHWQQVDEIDEESRVFIDTHNTPYLLRRGKEELDWILKYPWMINKGDEHAAQAGKYHFSLVANQFENICIKLWIKNQLLALVLLTNRDLHFKLPYVFIEPGFETQTWRVIRQILSSRKAKSLVVFNPVIRTSLSAQKLKCLYKKIIFKHMGFPVSWLDKGIDKYTFQDGDGDAVFT